MYSFPPHTAIAWKAAAERGKRTDFLPVPFSPPHLFPLPNAFSAPVPVASVPLPLPPEPPPPSPQLFTIRHSSGPILAWGMEHKVGVVAAVPGCWSRAGNCNSKPRAGVGAPELELQQLLAPFSLYSDPRPRLFPPC